MPPGTGDVQMGLAKLLPRAEVLVVTTPAGPRQKVATPGRDMARKSFLRVAGVIENMSDVHLRARRVATRCSARAAVAALADEAGVPLLGADPARDPGVAPAATAASPPSLGDGPAAEAFRTLAEAIHAEAIPPVQMVTCTARQAIADLISARGSPPQRSADQRSAFPCYPTEL